MFTCSPKSSLSGALDSSEESDEGHLASKRVWPKRREITTLDSPSFPEFRRGSVVLCLSLVYHDENFAHTRSRTHEISLEPPVEYLALVWRKKLRKHATRERIKRLLNYGLALFRDAETRLARLAPLVSRIRGQSLTLSLRRIKWLR